MGGFPYLLTLFLVTVVAALAWAARSWRKAEKAPDANSERKSVARMAAPRSRAGELMSDMIEERDGKLAEPARSADR